MIPVPIYDENHRIIRTVEFVDNLTLNHPPYQIQEGWCSVGLKRLNKGRYKDMLVLMFYDNFFPSCSHAEFISEEAAYELCLNRGKSSVIEEYDIHPCYDEGEVIVDP